MKATLSDNGSFAYTADLGPVHALPGAFSLQIASDFDGAKVPAPRTVFSVTLDRAGLLALRDLIDAQLDTRVQESRNRAGLAQRSRSKHHQ